MDTSGSSNPFTAPAPPVEPPAPLAAPRLLSETRQVPAGAALEWLRTGWQMFTAAPAPWIGIAFIYGLIAFILGVLPLVGMLNALLTPVFAAGILMAAEAQRQGTAPSLGHLFAGFQRNTGNLVLVGVLYLVGIAVVAMVVAGGGAAAMLPALLAGDRQTAAPVALGAIGVVMMLAVLLGIPLTMTVLYAPALVALHDVPPVDALKRSFSGSARNWQALLVYAVIAVILCVLGAIPLGLGLLVVGPVLSLAWWASYRQMFVE